MGNAASASSEKVINLINGRCGGNKTGYIVSQIESRLSDNPNQCIIYSAPTKLVLSEVFNNRLINIDDSQKQLIVSDDSITESVTSRITKLLEAGYTGCLLITHSALFNLSTDLLTDKLVIIDESPEQTVKFTHIEVDENQPPAHLAAFSELVVAVPDTTRQEACRISAEASCSKVALTKEANRLKAMSRFYQERGNIALSGEITEISKLYFAAASEHGYIYLTRLVNDDGSAKNIYRSIDTGDIAGVVKNAANVWIASADFEYGLLSYILDKYHGIATVKVEGTNIPLVHDNANVTIIPLLSDEKNWSKTFSESDRSKLEGFQFTDIEDYSYKKTVFAELFEFGCHCVLSEQFDTNDEENKALMFVNVAKQAECAHDCFIQVSTQSHGQNGYQAHHHALWMATLVPNPNELIVLEQFCKDVGICHLQAKEALNHSRQYAPLYQGLARTSLRAEASTGSNLFVVPDAASAEALLKWIPNATIETSYLFTLAELQSQKIEFDAKKMQRMNLAFDLFGALMSVEHGQKQHIYDSFGMERKQISRLKKEFSKELSEAGLLPTESDYDKAMEAKSMIDDSGLSVRKACELVGLSRGKYNRITKKSA